MELQRISTFEGQAEEKRPQEAEKIQSVRSVDLRERGVKEEDANGSSKIRTET